MCFPYAGGAAAVYRGWPRHLPQVEILAVQYAGRGDRLADPPHRRMEPLVAELHAALEPLLDDRPLAFFGHSLGALVAYELALRLASRSAPDLFIVSACRPPHLVPERLSTRELDDAEFLEHLRRLGGTPREVLEHEELMELLLPSLRADFAVLEGYVASPTVPPLDCPVVVVGGTDDREVPPRQLGGWDRYSRHPVPVHLLPDDHFFLRQPHHEDAVCRLVGERLAQCRSARPADRRAGSVGAQH